MYVVALTKPHGFNDLSIMSDNVNLNIETGHNLIDKYVFWNCNGFFSGFLFSEEVVLFLSLSLALSALKADCSFLIDKQSLSHALFF